jgi:hypothetical protein
MLATLSEKQRFDKAQHSMQRMMGMRHVFEPFSGFEFFSVLKPNPLSVPPPLTRAVGPDYLQTAQTTHH